MSFFPVMYSLLSAEALLSHIMGTYKLNQPAELQFFLRGMNDTYILTAGQEKYIFRVYRADLRSQSEIFFELDLLAELHQKGIAVSIPIPRIDGKLINEFNVPEGIRYGVLFSYAEGHERHIRTPEDSYAVGKAAAEIHKASEGFRSSHNRGELNLEHLIDKPLRIIQAHMAHRRQDYEFLYSLIMQLRQRLDMYLEQGLDWGICHGDLHGNTNAAFAENGTLTHYDFDICGFGWRAYDIAEFRLAREIHSGHDKNEVEQLWQAFLQGYAEVRELGECDLQAVPLFVALRQLWLFSLCFSEAAYVGAADFDDGFIDGKLEYFRGLNLT
ncbi:phosphotransferase enzyme family protein [Paenibacillus sp. GCM10012306]|uniref:phosphotransferase enzyme family protein n=1 Tax=Paenibacillus sp. GCM10012306 TaxID=3317342 RepID=UPI00360EC756